MRGTVRMVRTKSKTIEVGGESHTPTAEDMELINRLALTELRPEEVYVRSMILCTGAYDRDYERFSREVLEQFAESIVGKSLLIGHRHDAAPEGLFYRAEVVEIDSPTGEGRVPALKAHFYMVRTAENEHLRRLIDAGVLRYVSIGFRCEDLICDLCEKSIYSNECPHIPGRTYDGQVCTATWRGRAEAVEGSIVYLGSQYGAEIQKGTWPSEEARRREERAVSWAQVAALKALLEERAREIEELKRLAEDGRRLREELLEEIRRLGRLVREEATANRVADALAEASIDEIKEVIEEYERKCDALYPVRPWSVSVRREPREADLEAYAG